MRKPQEILNSIGCKGKFNVNKQKANQAISLAQEEAYSEAYNQALTDVLSKARVTITIARSNGFPYIKAILVRSSITDLKIQ